MCSRCGKTLTDDPTLPISQMGGNVFLRSDSPGAGIVVKCGACAGRMVLMTLVRQGALAPTHATDERWRAGRGGRHLSKGARHTQQDAVRVEAHERRLLDAGRG